MNQDLALSRFTFAYVTNALWNSTDDQGNPLDHNYDRSDFDPAAWAKMQADCRAFFVANQDHIYQPDVRGPEDPAAQAGHDFWLTRNGHGAGFWDGDWPEPAATALTDAAEAFGEVDLYVGDDGRIYA